MPSTTNHWSKDRSVKLLGFAFMLFVAGVMIAVYLLAGVPSFVIVVAFTIAFTLKKVMVLETECDIP